RFSPCGILQRLGVSYHSSGNKVASLVRLLSEVPSRMGSSGGRIVREENMGHRRRGAMRAAMAVLAVACVIGGVSVAAAAAPRTATATATATETATATPTPTASPQPTVSATPTPVGSDLTTPAPLGTSRLDVTPPTVSKLKLKAVPHGAKVSFSLSEQASVTI